MKKLILIFLSIILVCSCNQKEDLCVSTTILLKDSKSNNIDEVKGILKSTDLTKQVLKKLSMDTSLVTINKYARNLRVKEISKESSILKLTIEGQDKQIRNYLDMLLVLYVEQELERKNMAITNTIHFIDDSLYVIRDSLTFIEHEWEIFKSKNQIQDYNSDNKILIRLNNNEQMYVSLIKKRTEALLIKSANVSDIRIIDKGMIEKCQDKSKAIYIFTRIKDLLN